MATKVTENSSATIKPKKEKPKQVAVARPRPAGSGAGAFGKMGPYLREVQTELRKTTWPSKKELIASVQVVLGLLVVVGIYIWVLDTITARALQGLLYLAQRLFHR